MEKIDLKLECEKTEGESTFYLTFEEGVANFAIIDNHGVFDIFVSESNLRKFAERLYTALNN